MYVPPPAPPDRSLISQPTWRGIVASYAAMVAIPLLLWIVSRPLVGAVTLALVAGASVGAGRAYGLARCLAECRQVAFDLGGNVRVTIAKAPADEAC